MTQPRLSFGVTILTTLPPQELVAAARESEALGFDFFWLTDSSLHGYFVYPYLTLAATNTKSIRLGTNCTHPLTMHPAMTANAATTINAISRGRAILGIGAGGGPTAELRPQGKAKINDLEEMVSVTRRLLTGERVTFEGDDYQIKDAHIMYGLEGLQPPKIYITASGPRTFEMAGRVADGVLMTCGGSREGLEFAINHVRTGAEAAGRSVDDLDLAWHVFGTFDEDPEVAYRLGSQAGAMFANAFPVYCAMAGIPDEKVAEVKRAYVGARHFTEARAAHRLVTRDMVERLTVSGGKDLWEERVAIAREMGISHIELFVLGEPLAVLRGLAGAVLAPGAV